MVVPIIVAGAAAAGGGAAAAGGAAVAGGAAAGAGAAGAGAAAGASGAAVGAEATAARSSTLVAERHAAKQAAGGGPTLPSNVATQESELALDQPSQWRTQEHRLRVARSRAQQNTLDISEDDLADNVLDNMQNSDEGDEEGQEAANDPVARLKQMPKKLESAVYGALDNPAITERGSDAVSATIQGIGFTSLTLVDFCLGLMVGFPLTILQFLITFRLIRPPQPGTKMKLLYDMLDYHVWSTTGLFKVEGGLMVLFMGAVSLTLLVSLFAVIFVPIVFGTSLITGGGTASQTEQATTTQ